jgi:hypothetical protein
MWLVDGGTQPTAGSGGVGGAPVRKRVRGPAMQLWGETENVLGGLVWAMWGQSGASTCESLLARVGVGAAS